MENKRNPKLLKTVLICILLCGALLAGILFFSTPRFPNKTVLCGQNLSIRSISSSARLISRTVSDYQLKLTLEDKEYVLSAADLGLEFQQESFLEQAEAAVKADTQLQDWDVLQWDAEKLEAFLDRNFDERRSDSAKPEIQWNGQTDTFEFSPGQTQTFYSRELVTRMITEAVGQLRPELVITSDAIYTEGSHQYDETAQKLAQLANEKLSIDLEFVFDVRGGSRTVISADKDRLASLLRFDFAAGVITVDETEALAYAEELAEGRDVIGAKANFLTHNNIEIDIAVEVADRYVDRAALAADLIHCLTENVSGSRDVAYISTTDSPNFEGTYLEVSVADQHLWLYEDGKVVVETDIVTGNVRMSFNTPTGRFQIHNHYRNVLLSPGYFVEYWMAFFADGRFGFHDADHWREPEEYGGTTYIKAGSGGCINVPIDIMRDLYARVENGTPVVVYDQTHVAPIYGLTALFWDDDSGPLDLNLKIRAKDAKLTYSSSDESLATVTQDGIVTLHAKGSVVITVYMEATEEYEAYTHKVYIDIF